ncbi:MAG: glycosyltransferase family 2 protein [Lachnospiraceae bacterium]|nr:glycosyltransferase family 2 protein [Lachnospiraceae bacterium]
MNLEMLISAVKAEPDKLIETMKIECPAVLVNQCGRVSFDVLERESGQVRVFSSDERGVGRSRNKALSEAKGDILLFADEDIVYDKGYAERVIKEFEAHPEADGLFFNVRVCEERRTYWNEDYKRVRIWNGGRYPAYSIALRKSAVERAAAKGKELRFSELFGGGAKYSCGEDSIFIRDCLKAGLKLYRSVAEIGEEIPRPSTWFKGYDEKYFFDRGVMYHFLYGALAYPMGVRYVLIKKKLMCQTVPWRKAIKELHKGIKEGRRI